MWVTFLNPPFFFIFLISLRSTQNLFQPFSGGLKLILYDKVSHFMVKNQKNSDILSYFQKKLIL